MQTDPIAGSIANPQSLNRYIYSLNDPVNRLDPLGLESWESDASFHGPGVILDGTPMEGQLANIAIRMWQIGAANLLLSGAWKAKDGSWQVGEKSLSEANDQLRLLPISFQRVFNPCAGNLSKFLVYNKPRKYMGVTETAEKHIKERHASGPHLDSHGTETNSYYITDPMLSTNNMFEHAKMLNAFTFEYPDDVIIQGNGNYAFIKTFPPVPHPLKNKVAGWIGFDVKRFNYTLTNTLIVQDDCVTVVTSFSGTP
jgi:hypothetical protein